MIVVNFIELLHPPTDNVGITENLYESARCYAYSALHVHKS